MAETGRAYFVDFPRQTEDLTLLHDIDAEHEYEIVATVTLGAANYENFITDMAADRQFIEAHHTQCSTSGVWKCLLVRQRGKNDGVLVIPTDRRYAKLAAYYISKKVGVEPIAFSVAHPLQSGYNICAKFVL